MPINDCDLGVAVLVRYPDLVNLYGYTVGQDTQIGP